MRTHKLNRVKRKPVPSEFSLNLQHHLWDRESGFIRRNWRCKSPPWHQIHEREFYRSIRPNLTVQNIKKPNCYIRKFTPDGQQLLCFSHDQRKLELYTFHGVAYSGCLLHGMKEENITAADGHFSAVYMRQRIFYKFFTLHKEILVIADPTRCQLNREFSIFLVDGLYVLVGGTTISMEMPPATMLQHYPDWNDNNDLHCYTFFLVNLKTGIVCDQYRVPHDCITLSHNHGVSVYDHTIIMLSKTRQCIDILQLVDGKLQRLYEIGPHPDGICAACIRHFIETDDSEPNPMGTLPYSFIKQSILVYLFKEVVQQPGSVEIRRKRLLKFYKQFSLYENMLMAKAQLLNSDTILIRYEKRPSLAYDSIASNGFRLFVFYCLTRKAVLKIYKNDSVELLMLLRNNYDCFRNVFSATTSRHSSSPSNDANCRLAYNRAVTDAYGGLNNAAKILNPTLPISSQSYTTSSYLDYSLYLYDDRLISQSERPRFNIVRPIPFRDRFTEITSFHLFLEPPSANIANPNRQLVAFVFHPFEPLIISIQKLSSRFVVNFHFYNPTTLVSSRHITW